MAIPPSDGLWRGECFRNERLIPHITGKREHFRIASFVTRPGDERQHFHVTVNRHSHSVVSSSWRLISRPPYMIRAMETVSSSAFTV